MILGVDVNLEEIESLINREYFRPIILRSRPRLLLKRDRQENAEKIPVVMVKWTFKLFGEVPIEWRNKSTQKDRSIAHNIQKLFVETYCKYFWYLEYIVSSNVDSLTSRLTYKQYTEDLRSGGLSKRLGSFSCFEMYLIWFFLQTCLFVALSWK